MSEAENDAVWAAKLIITERDATITALREEVKRARFSPLGDNHHNALACPYCNPKQLDPEAALTALRQRVVEVVGPFAELVPAAFPPVWGGDEQIVLRTHLKGDAASLRIDDFRAARALINEIKETTDGR